MAHAVAVPSDSNRATPTDGVSITRPTSSATAAKSSRGGTPSAASVATRRRAACSRVLRRPSFRSRLASAVTAPARRVIAPCSSIGSRGPPGWMTTEAEPCQRLHGSVPKDPPPRLGDHVRRAPAPATRAPCPACARGRFLTSFVSVTPGGPGAVRPRATALSCRTRSISSCRVGPMALRVASSGVMSREVASRSSDRAGESPKSETLSGFGVVFTTWLGCSIPTGSGASRDVGSRRRVSGRCSGPRANATLARQRHLRVPPRPRVRSGRPRT